VSWAEPILHVDMDSFFVEVERLAAPELIGRPVAVGGAGPRGVIASASYEARAHGARSAQPTAIARRLCPELIVVPADHGRYAEVSEEVFALFRSITPLVEGLSLDEAFLDVSGLRLHHVSPVEVAESIRGAIRSELGLPASVGVASVKFIAKLASEAAKPDGIMHVPTDEQLIFLHALPASAMWGVGPATLAALERLGVETIGDIATLPENSLVNAVGPAAGRQLHDLSQGRDGREVTPDIAAKSISVEETFENDLVGTELVETALLAHAQRLSGRLRRAGLRGRTITLKVRYPDFSTITRSQTTPMAVDGSRQLFLIATELLSGLGGPAEPVRLLGLGASALEPADQPKQLDIDDNAGWDSVERAIAGVRERFGETALGPARLIVSKKSKRPDPEP
jgi:nucleotidyltransferase/DNA polymerase involved in DNA repair